MPKIAIIQRRIAHFRIPFFEKLNRDNDLDITVFHTGDHGESKLNFDTRVYRIRTINIGSLKLNICYKLLKPLLLGHFKVIVFEGALYNFPFIFYVAVLKLCNKKICWWSSGWEPYSTSKTKKFFRNLLYGSVSSLVDKIIVYNTRAQTYYLSLRNKTSKIHIAWNVINEEILLKAERSVRSGDVKKIAVQLDLENKYVILYVGKIEPPKKLGLLINAYRLLIKNSWSNKITLIIIGDGSDKEKWESIVSREDIPNIYFLGEIRDPVTLAKFFKVSNVFVVPGAGGLAIYHAMVHGLPVFVSSADGTEADLVIDNKTGVYFKTDDHYDLAEKIHTALLRGDSYLRKIGHRAKHRVLRKFPMEKMINNFRNAILFQND